MRKIARSGLKTVVRQQHSRLNSVSYNTARQARHFSYSSLSFRGEISNSVQNNFESDQVTKISTASLQNNINNNSTTTTTTTEVEEPGYKPSVAYPQGHYTLPHPIWTPSHASKVHTTKHKNKEKISDWLAYLTIKTIRFNFDWLTGYAFKKHPSTQDWVNRLIFLETIAGVPGSVAGSLRHLKSLRSMRRDFGWIHTLLEEAENERMHLLSFLVLKENKTRFFRGMVMLSQGVFYNFYWLSYILFPGFCHRLVGYLEEEAVTTYTKLLQQIDSGKLEEWKTKQAPEVARTYWNMPEDATIRDLVLLIRADEAHHRDVNHDLSDLSGKADSANPYGPGH